MHVMYIVCFLESYGVKIALQTYYEHCLQNIITWFLLLFCCCLMHPPPGDV